jgi:hypothetical protein
MVIALAGDLLWVLATARFLGLRELLSVTAAAAATLADLDMLLLSCMVTTLR